MDFVVTKNGPIPILIGPDDTVTHTLLWAGFLGALTISSATWAADEGITIDSQSNTTDETEVQFTGPGDIANTIYNLTCTATLSNSDQIDQGFRIQLVQG